MPLPGLATQPCAHALRYFPHFPLPAKTLALCHPHRRGRRHGKVLHLKQHAHGRGVELDALPVG
eukprot:354198-Chlamydomonas_euryale.AAC.2